MWSPVTESAGASEAGGAPSTPWVERGLREHDPLLMPLPHQYPHQFTQPGKLPLMSQLHSGRPARGAHAGFRPLQLFQGPVCLQTVLWQHAAPARASCRVFRQFQELAIGPHAKLAGRAKPLQSVSPEGVCGAVTSPCSAKNKPSKQSLQAPRDNECHVCAWAAPSDSLWWRSTAGGRRRTRWHPAEPPWAPTISLWPLSLTGRVQRRGRQTVF